MKCLLSKVLVTGIVALFLLAIGTSLFQMNMVAYASGTIYIRADGSIEGTTCIESSDNVTYVFTADINDSIVVESSNIIVDGNGYTLGTDYVGPTVGFNLTSVSNVTINNASIKHFDTGIYLESAYQCIISGNNLTENNSAGILLISSSLNNVSQNMVTHNTFGIRLEEQSHFNTISQNKIADNGNGIDLSSIDFFQENNIIFGNDIKYNGLGIHFLTTSNCTVTRNNIENNTEGVVIYRSLYTTITENNITSNTNHGVYLDMSYDGTVYHNNFIANGPLYLYSSTNMWDNGYPSGGNYWSDYDGTDFYTGPYQNETGSDFIGDTEYKINDDNIDHYPFMILYETNPPSIIIVSPENKTYAVNASIPLTFTVDESASWMGYSLDGQANATITGNTTLPTLPDGWHYVAVYANDTYGNMGMSIVYFAVDTTPPIANAGNNKTVNEDTLVTFDGSASADENGIETYTWTFTDVTAKTLTGDKPTYMFSNPGVYTIALNVTDAAGNWAIDTVVMTILDITNPEAIAGQDQTVKVGETVTFDAGSSTDNVGIVSYAWNFGDGTSGTGKATAHEYTDAGTYTVTLTVEDAAGNQATDTMVVTVNAAEAFPWWIVAAVGIVAAGVVVAAVILWRRRKKT